MKAIGSGVDVAEAEEIRSLDWRMEERLDDGYSP